MPHIPSTASDSQEFCVLESWNTGLLPSPKENEFEAIFICF